MNDSGKELFSANAMSTDTGPSARVAGDTSSPDDPNLTVNAPKDINDNTGDLFASLPEFARKDVWMARDGGDSNVSVRNDVRRIVAASPTKVVESKMIEESEDFSIQGRLPAANRSALRIFAEGGIAADLSPVVPPLPAGISDDEIPPPADVVNGPSNEQQEANQENNPTEPKVTIPMDVVPAQDGAMQSLPNDVPVPELASSMAEEQPVTIAPAPADSVAQEAQKVVDQPAEASVPVETPKSIESWTPAVNMDDLFSELPDKPAIPETVPAQDIAATEVPAAVAEPEANESAQSPVAEPEPVVAPAT
ncbi:MAG: hypothetical protein MJ025_04165, partial [Victivallaceae bacterium]|nr:hypothetical protein [Victivallaceae bacterium]